MSLAQFFETHKKCALAFSGGVDSAYVLYVAAMQKCDIRPYFVKSQFQAKFELEDAKRLCKELKIPLNVLELDVLSFPEIARNPDTRCYFCKTQMMKRVCAAAKADGYYVVLDGTNASDDTSSRPGMRALSEFRVHSPLLECGITKDEVRSRSKSAGLFTWDKCANACLATRIPHGTRLTADGLLRVERAEDVLSAMGFSDFRVRVFHGAARIQLKEGQFEKAIAMREELVSRLSESFSMVFLDLIPR